tara:strand:- start:52 stop:1527 length:1476 start_codon:yes stop_codon:yes gene_type:complete
MDITLIFPHQLYYPSPALSKKRRVFLIEDPLFFSDKQYPANFHKQKILLHLMSLGSFEKKLKKNGYNVITIKNNEILDTSFYIDIFKKYNVSSVHYLDVHDYALNKRLESSIRKLGIDFYFYDTPGFFNKKDYNANYFSKKKTFFFTSFYKEQRKNLKILVDDENKPNEDKWTFDTENRKKLPKQIDIPELSLNKYDDDLLRHSKKIIDTNYSNNYGSIAMFNYPVNHKQAKKSFENFLKYRFLNFGPYEDAISTDHRFIFHSVVSPSLNIGLITPQQVIDMTLDFAKDSNIPINSLEGFIRQIIGWREFIRGIYDEKGSYQRNQNYWGSAKKIPSSFYDGTTGIYPVDETIKNTIKYAYSHHIERLMVLGNIMCLLRYDPNDVYKWFMELFIDAYDWVMVPNIYGMSSYADGGLMTTKPYISGSNYILKMSNYKKGEWCNVWDALFWDFIDKEREFFNKNPRMKMMVTIYDKKNMTAKQNYIKIVNDLQL